ncbi:MAG TPA: methyltransferase [Verrucomicrobiota bacterium]|nr:methyltransferase [Verrucomicrobiota bacterium]HNT14539.1 methyltransferase [Verrucomicrobiota bacterium]
MNIRKLLLRLILPPPVPTRHRLYSMTLPPDVWKSRPNARLISLALRTVARAQQLELRDLAQRAGDAVNAWPGEHYRLVAALVAELGAKRIVEIGTYQGTAALAMLSQLPSDGRITTFDVIPWRQIQPNVLRDTDFADGRLRQEIADLQDFQTLAQYREVFQGADFIFVDAAKDGIMEQRFIENFRRLTLPRRPLVMFDDVREWKMLRIWNEITEPKLDLTSFGHWTGTGWVDWAPTSQ